MLSDEAVRHVCAEQRIDWRRRNCAGAEATSVQGQEAELFSKFERNEGLSRD